jgi:putative transposase
VNRRRGFTITTDRDRRQGPAPDLVQRQFTAPDQLWVAHMTYIPTRAGFVDLAMV